MKALADEIAAASYGWRQVNGTVMEVAERNGWVYISGKVLSVLGKANKGDYLVTIQTGTTMRPNSKIVRLSNHSTPTHVDDEAIYDWAFPVGDYSYNSAGGSHNTVRAYDCGTKCEPPKEVIEARMKADADAMEASAKAAAQRKARGDEAALKFHVQQASNGMPSAQCSLGKRYLNGDGVAKDEALARYWLEKSAAQDNAEAKAALAKLPNSPPAPSK